MTDLYNFMSDQLPADLRELIDKDYTYQVFDFFRVRGQTVTAALIMEMDDAYFEANPDKRLAEILARMKQNIASGGGQEPASGAVDYSID